MDTAATIATARQRSGLTLRELAERASTSHSTLSAYETGSKSPNARTLDRIVRAAGFALDTRLHRRVDVDNETGLRRGDELAAVLELADAFPARHAPTLDAPIFGR